MDIYTTMAHLYAFRVRTRPPFAGTAAILSAFALAASLTACASTSPAVGDYPSDVRSNFLASCEAQPGATPSMCGRCLEAVEDAYTYDEFVKLETAIRMGTASRADSDKLANILTNCA